MILFDECDKKNWYKSLNNLTKIEINEKDKSEESEDNEIEVNKKYNGN